MNKTGQKEKEHKDWTFVREILQLYEMEQIIHVLFVQQCFELIWFARSWFMLFIKKTSIDCVGALFICLSGYERRERVICSNAQQE